MIANVMQLNCPTLYGRIVAEISAPHLNGIYQTRAKIIQRIPTVYFLFIYLFIYLF